MIHDLQIDRKQCCNLEITQGNQNFFFTASNKNANELFSFGFSGRLNKRYGLQVSAQMFYFGRFNSIDTLSVKQWSEYMKNNNDKI